MSHRERSSRSGNGDADTVVKAIGLDTPTGMDSAAGSAAHSFAVSPSSGTWHRKASRRDPVRGHYPDRSHVRSALALLISQGIGGGIEAFADSTLDALRSLGIDVEVLAMLSADRPRPSIWAKVRFSLKALGRAWVRRRDLDHVVVMHPSLSMIAVVISVMRSRNQQLPKIIFYDVADICRSPRWLLALLRRRGLPIATISSFSAGALTSAGAGSVTVLSPALSVDRYATFGAVQRRRTATDLQSPEILSVCRLDQIEGKGIPVLVEAVERLRTTHPAVTVVVAGRGPAPAELLALADARSWILVVESPSTTELAECYRRASIFVLATRTQSFPGRYPTGEGFGLVLAEAQLAGLPVVAPASGGSTDAVIDGITAMRPTDESSEALASALTVLLDDAVTYARMSENAAAWAAHAFSPERAVTAVQAALLDGITPTAHGLRLSDEPSHHRDVSFGEPDNSLASSINTVDPNP